jgi:hypothetical protein
MSASMTLAENYLELAKQALRLRQAATVVRRQIKLVHEE